MSTGYGVITSQKMPWLTKTKKGKAQVVYPIFEQASELTDDLFWKSILAKAAMGKFPVGFSYKNSQLMYKRGTKLFKTLIEGSPLEALTVSLDFFRDHGGIRSELDRQREESATEAGVSFLDLEWSDLAKKKDLRALLIGSYVRAKAIEMGLTSQQRNQLRVTISAGFLLGSLTDRDVVYSRGEIHRIDGIGQVDGHFVLLRQPKAKRTTAAKPKPKASKNDFLSLWQKYLDAITKRGHCSTTLPTEESEE